MIKRKNIRLKGYDYSSPDAYFITICSLDKINSFGQIVEEKMELNSVGQIINKWWEELSNKFEHIEIDKYVIMPNHFYGIIFLNLRKNGYTGRHIGLPLHAIIQWFKTMTTNEYIRNCKPDSAKLWQRNYYEHIIRNEKDLNEIREYIVNNPQKWDLDEENLESLAPRDLEPLQ